MKDQLQVTKQWFEVAIPEPTLETACVQMGVHIEEFAEMFEALGINEVSDALHLAASAFKRKLPEAIECINNCDRVSLLDSLADQEVTGVGIAHNMGFDIIGALAEVNRSNRSKFEYGKPVFDGNGKITKGRDYTPPRLEDFIKC